jgi:hypothetical protein
LQVAGKPFGSGIGVLANSRLEVQAGQARTFTATVGVDDWTRNREARVRFLIYGDGKLLAQSPDLAAGSAAVPIRASLAGVKIMELVVRTTPGERVPPSVVWGDAALLSR